MEKLQAGDIVRLKRGIFAAHKRLEDTGRVCANPYGPATVGTIFVNWVDGTHDWIFD